MLDGPAYKTSSVKTPKKILIIKPSSLGDVVHGLPFLNAVSHCFPESEIHWVIARGLEGLLEGNPMVKRLIVINKDIWKKISRAADTVLDVNRLFREIRKEGYDLAIDLQGLLRSGLISMASGAPVRIGFAEAREGSRFLYTDRVKGGRDLHAVDRYLKIAAAMGCDTDKVAFPFPFFRSEDSWVSSFIRDLREYAVLVPGARWKTKVWPAEYFGKVASMIPMRSVVVGSSADIGVAEEIVATSGGKAVSVAGKTTLKELIEIMRGARIAISNDSGPMHIAAAVGVTVIAIFGPTSPQRTGPYGKSHLIIQSGAVCSPCFKKNCVDLKCMREVMPEDVGKKAMDVLKS